MTPQVLLALTSVFVAAVLITVAASTLISPGGGVRRRMQALTGPSLAAAREGVTTLTEGLDPRLRRLRLLVPKSPKNMSRLERRLARAGWHGIVPVVAYSLSELLLPMLAGGLVALYFGLHRGWILVLIAVAVAYMIPGLVLQRGIQKRKSLISTGLPDALDLLIVCVEAGLSLDQAIVKASEELFVSHPQLAEELRTITTEMRAGKPRLDAFRNFAARTGDDDVKSLVTMLVQTDRFGTSIAQALRTQAEVSRTKRRQRAEERAHKLGVKLVIPLVLFLFPAQYVVTLGPAAIKIARVFFGQVMRGQ